MSNNKTIYTTASKINKTHFYYECPVCVSKYTDDGKPRKGAKPIIHKSGSNGELHNRREHRTHKANHQYGHKWFDVYINITDSTIKDL